MKPDRKHVKVLAGNNQSPIHARGCDRDTGRRIRESTLKFTAEKISVPVKQALRKVIYDFSL